MRQALLGVGAAFAQKLPELPPGTLYQALQMSPNAIMPFVSYALISKEVTLAELSRLARYQIVPLLTGIPGVSRVGVLGGQTPQVQVALSPPKLAAYGLTLAEISNALSATNTVKALGRLEDNDLLYLTISNNAFTSVESVANVAVRTAAGAIVFMRTQPKSIELYKWYDQTDLVRSSISAVAEAIAIGLVFAALVIVAPLRNWRVTLVAMIVVPLSVLITVLLLSLLGMSFNIMTLGGIAAAIGLLIDDVIVMIEHIARRVGVPGLRAPHAAVLPAVKSLP
jgi:multidrug efflux pump subunit AcrB